MQQALVQAQLAAEQDEVPVGAVIVDGNSGQVIAAGYNLTESLRDPTAHAEMLVIREACRILNVTRLSQCDLYVTLEPCAMCAQALSFARIRRLYFGAFDPKGGAVEHGARIFSQPTCHHQPEIIGGIAETACSTILKTFFAKKRG